MGPWSQIKFINTPGFDPVTGIYTPPSSPEVNSLKSQFTSLEFELFPNPNSGAFSLRADFPKDGTLELSMFDLTGRHIRSVALKVREGLNSYEIIIDHIPIGLYLLQGRLENEQVIRTTVLIE